MKISSAKLKQIIKEEIDNVLSEKSSRNKMIIDLAKMMTPDAPDSAIKDFGQEAIEKVAKDPKVKDLLDKLMQEPKVQKTIMQNSNLMNEAESDYEYDKPALTAFKRALIDGDPEAFSRTIAQGAAGSAAAILAVPGLMNSGVFSQLVELVGASAGVGPGMEFFAAAAASMLVGAYMTDLAGRLAAKVM